MALGTLVAQVRLLHIGILKRFGYPDVMLDATGERAVSQIPVVSEELLNHPDIQSAIHAGALRYVPAETQFVNPEDPVDPVPPVDPPTPTTPNDETTPPPVISSEETSPNPTGDSTTPESPESVTELQLTQEQTVLIEEIDALTVSEARDRLNVIEDLTVISILSETAKKSGTQRAARERLEALLGASS